MEEQQAEATTANTPKRDLTAAQKAMQSMKEGLTLSRSRVQAQLLAAQNPRYRKMLEETIAELDRKLGKLGL